MSTVGGLGKSVLRYYGTTVLRTNLWKSRRQGSCGVRNSAGDQGQPTLAPRTNTQNRILYVLSAILPCSAQRRTIVPLLNGFPNSVIKSVVPNIHIVIPFDVRNGAELWISV